MTLQNNIIYLIQISNWFIEHKLLLKMGEEVDLQPTYTNY